MGFTNPPVLGSAVELLADVAGFTDVLGVSAIPSLLIQPSFEIAGYSWATISVKWYSDPAGQAVQAPIATESHSVQNITGTRYPVLPIILTQCKAAYAKVETWGPGNAWLSPLSVYSSNAQVVGSRRLDQINNPGFPPMLGLALTDIPAGSRQALDTVFGCAANVTTRQLMCAIAAVGTTTGTTTLTPSFQVYRPGAAPTLAGPDDPTLQTSLIVGTLTGPGVTTPTTGGTIYTAPLTLPALPADCPFLVTPVFNLAAPAPGEFAVTTYVY